MPLAVIVILIVLAVFFFIYASGILSEGGILRRSTSAVDEAIQKIPGVGDDEFDRIEVPPPPKEIGEKFQKLIDTLNTQTTKESCILNYGGLPDLQGYSIEFLPRTEPGPKFITQLRGPDGRIADIQYVNPQLCVVAGTVEKADYSAAYNAKLKGAGTYPFKDYFTTLGLKPSTLVAENFYNNWIIEKRVQVEDPQLGKAVIEYNNARYFVPDYKDVQMLLISDEENMAYDGIPAGKEDGGLLYVPDNGKVCLFPTFDGDAKCNANENGLDDDCLESEEGDLLGEEHNLPYLIRNKKVPTCS